MIQIKIFDSIGKEVQMGDLVKIQNKRNGALTFFARVQVMHKNLFPFNKFAFDRIVKVDELPQGVNHVQARGDFPEYWMHPRVELLDMEQKSLDNWNLHAMVFEHNPFFEVVSE